MRSGRAPTVLSLLLGVGLALASSACGADEPEAGPDPTSGPTPAPAEEVSGSSEPGASTAPAPATGPRIRLPVLQVRLPDDGWIISAVDGGFGSGIASDGTGQVLVDQFPDISTTPDLDVNARIALQEAKRLESFPMAYGEGLLVDGVEARTIEGSGDGVHVYVLKSLVTQPEQLSINLEVRTTGSADLHRERVDAVLASWEWR